MVSEQRIFLISDLHWRATVLQSTSALIRKNLSNKLPPSSPEAAASHWSTYLWNQNLVSNRHGTADSLPILIETTGSNSQHLRLVQFLDTRLWEEDSRGGLSLGLDALHQDAVEQGSEGLDGLECGSLQIELISFAMTWIKRCDRGKIV